MAGPIRAERAVGLEAQGVDPLAALNNPGGLDVRDELGRPVSASLVASQMQQAQVRQAVEAAYASAAPEAAVVAAVLQMIQALRLVLRGGTAGETPQALIAILPCLRALERSVVPALLFLAAAVLAFATSFPAALAATPASARAPRVMRC